MYYHEKSAKMLIAVDIPRPFFFFFSCTVNIKIKNIITDYIQNIYQSQSGSRLYIIETTATVNYW